MNGRRRQENGQAEKFFGFHLKCFTFLFVIHCCKLLSFYSSSCCWYYSCCCCCCSCWFSCHDAGFSQHRRYLWAFVFLATLAWREVNQDRRGSATQTQLVCQRKLSVSWASQAKARLKEISFEQNEAIKIYLKKYAKKDEKPWAADGEGSEMKGNSMQQICQGFAADNLC